MGSAIGIAVLVLLAGAARTAVVLPRPPSSPNHIPQEYSVLPAMLDPSKSYIGEKAMYQSANVVEKPDTHDYRFVEIEVRDAEDGRPLDVRGLVRAVLDTELQHRREESQLSLADQPRRFDEAALDPENDSGLDEPTLEGGEPANASWPHPEVVPHSIFGVRDVGLGPVFTGRQQQYQLQLLAAQQQQQQQQRGPKGDGLVEADEKLYYLKSGARPKVYVNFRGGSGDARHHQLGEPASPESRLSLRLEPAAAFLRATQPYRSEKKTEPPKKYEARLHGDASVASKARLVGPTRTTTTTTTMTTTGSTTTTENAMVTSSELPKQIPAPPSRIPSRPPIAHTTPVQRYTARRTDILPGYAFPDA